MKLSTYNMFKALRIDGRLRLYVSKLGNNFKHCTIFSIGFGLLNTDLFALIISSICFASFSYCFFTACERPVTIAPISTKPVVGSTADFNNASSITVDASWTSRYSTLLDSRIFAKASLNLIRDYSCLGVAVIVLLEFPIFLISQ